MSLLLGIASFPVIAHFLAIAGTYRDVKITDTTFFYADEKKYSGFFFMTTTDLYNHIYISCINISRQTLGET